jgi:hypothetical protein
VSVVLAARPGEEAATILRRALALDQRLWHLATTLPGANAVRRRLHEQGVSVVSVGCTRDKLDEAASFGSALRVRVVVVEGDTLLDGEDVEGAADRMVRTLHPYLADGVPLAIRNTGEPAGLLGMTGCEWMLDELPRLVLWLDPARALRRHRADLGPPPSSWTDAFAHRTGGVFVHGLGSEGLGGAHPDDDGPDWRALRGVLPGAAPWVLELDSVRSEDEVADALRYVRTISTR